MIDELEQLGDPYERLAWCIDQYLINTPDLENLPLFKELVRFDLLDRYPHDRVEQVRTYCEILNTSFPTSLITKFEDYIRSKVDKWLVVKPASVEDIAEVLGFIPNKKLRHGMQVMIAELEFSIKELSEAPEFPSRQMIHGAGGSAFNHIEAALEYIISFYGRWFVSKIAGPTSLSFVENLINEFDLSKNTSRPLRKWYSGEAGTNEKYRLDISDSLPVIRYLNTFVDNRNTRVDRDLLATFQATFEGRTEIVREESLAKIDSFREKRGKLFAHGRLPEVESLEKYRKETIGILRGLLEFLTDLRDNKIVPPIIVVLRRLTMGNDWVRLDYIDEQGITNHKRFRTVVNFYPQAECFFYVLTSTQPIEENNPIIMPVDFMWSGDAL